MHWKAIIMMLCIYYKTYIHVYILFVHSPTTECIHLHIIEEIYVSNQFRYPPVLEIILPFTSSLALR